MLLKGINKRVIVIKNPESEIFEEAYFIVKNKSIFNQAKENDMVLEANRIISDYSQQQKMAAADNKNNKSSKNSKVEKSEKKAINNTAEFAGEDIFDESDFFAKNNFTASNHSSNLNHSSHISKPVYSSQNSGFNLVSSRKIRKIKIPALKVPPKSFFIGIGVMSAVVIAARIFEFILSR